MGRDKTPGEANSSEALLLIDSVHTPSEIEKKSSGKGGSNKEGCLSFSPSRSLAMLFCLNINDDENTRNQGNNFPLPGTCLKRN